MTKQLPSIDRIAELQQLIANFAHIERVPQLADTGRQENDVDHSFGLALTCWFLAREIAPHLSLEKILCYTLAHDLVELHSGDTFIFDEEAVSSKSEREDAALEKLAEDWPDFPELAEFADIYKKRGDEEAKFVSAVDKILPVIMINLGEKDICWNRHKVTAEMMKENKRKTIPISKEVAPYYEMLVEWMTNPDYFYKPDGINPEATSKQG